MIGLLTRFLGNMSGDEKIVETGTHLHCPCTMSLSRCGIMYNTEGMVVTYTSEPLSSTQRVCIDCVKMGGCPYCGCKDTEFCRRCEEEQ